MNKVSRIILGYTLATVSVFAGKTISISVDGSDLVTYQAAPLAEPLGGEAFKGSNFIHPLKTPGGFTVTDSEPSDHFHHFGLWWPWKYIEHGDRKILCWELQKGEGLVEAREAEQTPDGLLTRSVYIDRKAPEGPTVRLNETTRIRASRIFDSPARGYYLDLEITHEVAGDEPVTISKYRYSGFGYRGSALWDKDTSTLLTSEGADRDSSNGKAARWIRVEGTNGEGGTAGVLLMGHPENRSHPERLRTWNSRQHDGAVFVNFNPVMSGAWVFEPGQSYTRKYRLFIYDGSLSAEAAEAIWTNYEG